jgi:hypothetical protein
VLWPVQGASSLAGKVARCSAPVQGEGSGARGQRKELWLRKDHITQHVVSRLAPKNKLGAYFAA